MDLYVPAASNPEHAVRWSLSQKMYTDLLIRCDNGKHEILVPKAVVCPQSKFLQNSCKKEWAKTTTREDGPTTVVELPDDSIVAVNAMIDYFYHHTYFPQIYSSTGTSQADTAIKSAWKASESQCHLKVFVIADKYGLDHLHAHARQEFSKSLRSISQQSDFAIIMKAVYENTGPSDPLRSDTATMFAKHYKKAIKGDSDKLTEIIAELLEFGTDLAKALCRRFDRLRSKYTIRIQTSWNSKWRSGDTNSDGSSDSEPE
ncbi:hypothetical protein BLS_005202 [Venturia inaequalis]|uniref:BTB domain-containing protein n=1 Tax=Venturia inaequalis TaxID=5025 RepID=A0A8H3YQK3_VENIN|nr:hypothetical protein BLS_005202 [Venturia inaequalis]KAE9992533.1 hypothetical protein EG327_008670 [Venturia inaequalis]